MNKLMLVSVIPLTMILCSCETGDEDRTAILKGMQMRGYTVKKTSSKVPLSDRIAGTAWSDAEKLSVDNYPWFKSGRKQATMVRMLYDERAVYVQFLCEDKHIYADHTEVNSSVCQDSCIEFFATPWAENDEGYFNLEINCCGNFLLGWGKNVKEISANFVDPELSTAYLKIAASEPGPTKQESAKDDGWWVAVEIPFELLSKLSGRQIKPTDGTIWRANFYRCGGKTDPQYACWNWVDTPSPDYHRPEFFGELVFE